MFILLILAGAFACEGRRTFFSHFNKSKNFSRCRKNPTRIYTYMATDRIFILNRVSCWYVGVLVVKSAFLENEKKFSPDVNFYARIYIYGDHSHFYSESVYSLLIFCPFSRHTEDIFSLYGNNQHIRSRTPGT